MKKHIINILMLLLSATAVLSCSAGLAFDQVNPSQDSEMYFSLSISGSVTDIESGLPLEDMHITIYANQGEDNIYEKTAYTDNKGKFTIAWDGYRKPTSITAVAEDSKNVYSPGRHEMLISWDKNYNYIDGVFYIHDCNFYLQKKQ